MKTKILFPVVMLMVMSACVTVAAQTETGLSQVTLYWFSPGRIPPVEKTDRSRSAVNFETGQRGSDGLGYDLRYGGMAIGTPAKPGEVSQTLADWLGVLDCRSMIVDLGAKQWTDFKETPPFPKPKTLEPPRPLSRPDCVVNASAGRTDFSPYRQYVVVDLGHVYLMRLWHRNKISYVMFRVESFVARDNCVLSWKRVKPPNVADNESF
ncbi:MAG TPA: hypothetical protein VNG71_13175 [Pyrinomonadaceae bacterium]|nr:hypothetical protein [Pyrinomonadaceae bacterium]